MKKFILSTLLIFSIAALADCGPRSPSSAAAAEKAEETATCIYDGMTMNKKDMLAVDFGGKTYYTCDEKEKTEFLKSPDKYIKAAQKM